VTELSVGAARGERQIAHRLLHQRCAVRVDSTEPQVVVAAQVQAPPRLARGPVKTSGWVSSDSGRQHKTGIDR
jgi:hypothetical protein